MHALMTLARSARNHAIANVKNANDRAALLWAAKQVDALVKRALHNPRLHSQTLAQLKDAYTGGRKPIPIEAMPEPQISRRKVIDSSAEQRAARAAAIRGERP